MKLNSKVKGFIIFYAIGITTIFLCSWRMESLDNNAQYQDQSMVYHVAD